MCRQTCRKYAGRLGLGANMQADGDKYAGRWGQICRQMGANTQVNGGKYAGRWGERYNINCGVKFDVSCGSNLCVKFTDREIGKYAVNLDNKM